MAALRRVSSGASGVPPSIGQVQRGTIIAIGAVGALSAVAWVWAQHRNQAKRQALCLSCPAGSPTKKKSAQRRAGKGRRKARNGTEEADGFAQ